MTVAKVLLNSGASITKESHMTDTLVTDGQVDRITVRSATVDALLYKATQILAGVCDGAVKRDGQGFNKLDSHFGKEIASRPMHTWTPRIQAAAWKMVRKYKKQLKEAGINFADIPQPDVEKLLQEWELAKREMAAQKAPEQAQVKRVSLKEGNFWVQYPYNPDWNNELRQCVGYSKFFKDPFPHWQVPANSATVQGLRKFVRGKGFEATEDVKSLAEKLNQEAMARTQLSQATDGQLEIPGLGGKLLPFQKAGVQYILNARRVLLADQMGLGKTVESLAAAQAANAFPLLVICPRGPKIQWEREVKKWLPGKTVYVVSSAWWRKQRVPTKKYDVVIVNYDLLGRHKGKLCIFPRELTPKACKACKVIHDLIKKRFQMMVFDEAHKVKSYDRNRTNAVKMIAPQIPWLIGATGSPVMNYPNELVSPLEILGHIDAFGGRWGFIRRYCAPTSSKFGIDTKGAQNLQELNQKLRSLCFIRRTKDEVLPELPPKRRTMVPIELDNWEEYERVENDLRSWLIEKMLMKGEKNVDQAVWRSMQAEQLVRIEALKQTAARGKLAGVIEWVTDFLESGEKLVLFAHHESIQGALAAAFPGSAWIKGGQSDEVRQAEIDKFWNDEKCKLIVCSLKAGGEGLNLQCASNVAFVELGWNPPTHDQAEDRCHRINQKDQVNAWYLLAEDTIDMEIAELIEKKRDIVDTTTEGTEGARETGILNALVDKLVGSDMMAKIHAKAREQKQARAREEAKAKIKAARKAKQSKKAAKKAKRSKK